MHGGKEDAQRSSLNRLGKHLYGLSFSKKITND